MSTKIVNKPFDGKVALITGAGSGIGRETAITLAMQGATTLLLDRSKEAALETQTLISSVKAESSIIECDVANFSLVQDKLAAQLKEERLDILVNSAGVSHIGNIEETSENDFDRIYQINVKGMFNVMRAVVPKMKAQKCGVIVNLASIASTVGIEDRFAYSMSKGAVLSMTLSVARDYVNDGIRCNCVSPGRVHTPFVDGFLEKNYPNNRDEMFEKLSKSQPIGRMAKTEEVANLIVYLCSDAAAFITGSNYPIDGGFITLNN